MKVKDYKCEIICFQQGSEREVNSVNTTEQLGEVALTGSRCACSEQQRSLELIEMQDDDFLL